MSVIPVIKPKSPDSGTSAYWDFTAADYRVPIQQALNFSRSSSAWYWNEFGVLTEAAVNELRIDHDPATVDTSVTAHEMSATVKRFALSGSVIYTVGSRVRISYTSDSSQYMIGTVISSAAGTVRIAVDRVYGAGTYSDWTLIEVKGLLIEEQWTNLLTHSEEFDNAVWSKSNATVSANSLAAPDSAVSADKLVANTSASGHFLQRSIAGLTVGAVYTYSIFAKAGEYSTLAFAPSSGFDSNVVTVDLVSGTVVSGSASIQHINSGWYRITAPYTANATSSVFNAAYVINGASFADRNTAGDGTSGIYIWGAQLEQGSFPTSYIPTTSAQVTRSADTCSVDTLSPWFNASEGTVYTHGAYLNGTNAIEFGDWDIAATTDGDQKLVRSYNDATNPELVTNGTFDTGDFTGWTAIPTAPSTYYAQAEVISGQYVVQTQGGLNSANVGYQTVETIVGRKYVASVDVSSDNDRHAGLRINDVDYTVNDGTVNVEFTATTNPTRIDLRILPFTTNTIFTIDNVSVREVQPTAAGTLTLGNGTHKNLRYYPRELTASEQNALKGL